MVLAKLGACGQVAMTSISAMWSAMARSNAGRKCSGRIAANGGVSWGVVQASRRGLEVSFADIGGSVPYCEGRAGVSTYGGWYCHRLRKPGLVAPMERVEPREQPEG